MVNLLLVGIEGETKSKPASLGTESPRVLGGLSSGPKSRPSQNDVGGFPPTVVAGFWRVPPAF